MSKEEIIGQAADDRLTCCEQCTHRSRSEGVIRIGHLWSQIASLGHGILNSHGHCEV